MLQEWKGVRQRPEEGRRRWFTDEEMDLIVWYSGKKVRGFQLCYNKQTGQHALTWMSDGTYSHARVDDGETGREMGLKQTPILVQDGSFDAEQLARRFRAEAQEIDSSVREFVARRVRDYPGGP